MNDDRNEFKARQRANSIALGKDGQVFGMAVDALVAADRHEYPYLWSWWGVPIIQLPADVMATQEVIFNARPDIVIETGVARGGSLIFMASLLRLLGKGRVIGVDIDIRPHNRDSIERHPMADGILLIEGSSTDGNTLDRVKAEIPSGASVMVVLDSDHSRDHVLAELRAYGPLVTSGQYLVVADTLLGRLNSSQTPTRRSKVLKKGDEPLSAVDQFLTETSRFERDLELNGKLIFASSPGGYLRCIQP
jgi:cephalosporin hydroxylase